MRDLGKTPVSLLLTARDVQRLMNVLGEAFVAGDREPRDEWLMRALRGASEDAMREAHLRAHLSVVRGGAA